MKLASVVKLYVPDLLQRGSQKCVPEVQGHDGSADHLRRRCDDANKLSASSWSLWLNKLVCFTPAITYEPV